VVAGIDPQPIAAQVWKRRQAGECCVDVSMWLAQLGYRTAPDEVAVIASRYAQERDMTRADGVIRGSDCCVRPGRPDCETVTS
jgi:hypothetical protein